MRRILKPILVFVSCLTGQLFACNCNEARSVPEEFKHADAIFVGTILNKEIVFVHKESLMMYDTFQQDFPGIQYSFVKYTTIVEKLYKGKTTSDTVIIRTGMGGGDCGIRFEVGGKYIVYAESKSYLASIINSLNIPEEQNVYWTYSCLRTTAYYTEEIEELQKFAENQHEGNELILIDPEIYPVYKFGGDAGLQKFIKDNLHYPKTTACSSGTVYVAATIDIEGKVKDVELKRGISPTLDDEAIRVVKMLEFIPGSMKGIPVDMKMVFPISFKIK